jgi:hypothetical protein
MKTLPALLAAASFLLSHTQAASPAPRWAVSPDDRGMAIRCDGRPVAEFVVRDPRILRPHFANVCALDGTPATRTHPPVAGTDATDHDTMHPGLWLAFGDLSGEDFWRNKGRIEHARFSQPPLADGSHLTFATESRLLAASGRDLGSLNQRFTLETLPEAWLLVWEATFRADRGELVFGDQEEMGLGVRVATALTEKSGGLITNDRGLTTARATWGQPAQWCDYSGTIASRRVGLTLMADPANFRPSWWHNRDYGLMVANPFGRKAMNQGEPSRVVVAPNETLRLRFGVLVRSTPPTASPDLAAHYRRFVASSTNAVPPIP